MEPLTTNDQARAALLREDVRDLAAINDAAEEAVGIRKIATAHGVSPFDVSKIVREQKQFRPKSLEAGSLVWLSDMRRQNADQHYLIKDLVYLAHLIVVFGPPGGGKTFLLLSLLSAIASGSESWFGFRARRGTVVYVCLEGVNGLMNRLDALQVSGFKIDPALFASWPHSFDLTVPDDLISAIHGSAIEGPLVVIDTLNAAMVGRDENSSVDMGKAIAGARRIIAETGASVILVHHSAKDSTRGMRGHSSLLGASDVVIEVKKEHAMRSFTVTKCKEGPDGVSRYFDLRSMTLRHDQDGDPVTSCVVDPAESPTLIPNKPKGRPNQARQHILETMKRLADLSPDGGVALKILREEAGKDKGPNYRNTWYDNYPILLTSHMLREDAGIVYQVNDKA